MQGSNKGINKISACVDRRPGDPIKYAQAGTKDPQSTQAEIILSCCLLKNINLQCWKLFKDSIINFLPGRLQPVRFVKLCESVTGLWLCQMN